MKTRKETVEFIIKQFEDERDGIVEKPNTFHYGFVELRQLMDFIFEKEPENEEENLNRSKLYESETRR